MRKIIVFGVFGLFPFLVLAQNYTISGYVKDSQSGEVLIGANIYNAKKQNGTATNNFGYFSYTTAADSVDLLITYIGYAAMRIPLKLDDHLELNIELEPGDVLEEIVVTGEKTVEEVTQMSKITVPIALIKSMPSLMGEVDVMKALQMIPGVQSGTEGTSGLYVRGGGPDQNLILLDGVPLYNVSHLFGFVSVFNADAINHVDLVKGGFPARFGGRLSSVVDITLKEGNTEKLKGAGSIGLISSKLTLDGPISDNTTFLISGRRTYLDLLARPIIKSQSDGDEVGGYYFYDLNTKINHRFNNKNRVYLSGYFGNDKAYARANYDNTSTFYDGDVNYNVRRQESDDAGLKWGNFTMAGRWNHIFGPRLFGNLTITYSRYLFDIYAESSQSEFLPDTTYSEHSKIRYFSGINDIAGKVDFEFSPNPSHNIRFGGSVTNHRFNPGVLAYNSNIESDTTLGEQRIHNEEFFGYLEDEIEVTDQLNVNAGIHVSGFGVKGQNYASVEPRISFSYQIPELVTVKASYTRMSQYIHLLTNSGIGLPTDLWVPSTNRVEPQRSNQYALGIAKSFKDFEFTLEGYYKQMSNLIEYREGASYLEIESNWQDKVISGKGESYGAELFVQKKYGRWNGWAGYTLAWNFRQFEEVNDGRRFPYHYDRRHDVNLIVSYTPRKGLEYSLGWVFGTGNAISLPKSKYPSISEAGSFYEYQVIEYYGGRNQFRMNDYHRLDISATWTKPKRWGERAWTLGLYNAYNHKNPFFIDQRTKADYNPVTREYDYTGEFVQYSLFPLIPSITYSFKF